jgi:hypothetical protein
VLGIKAVIVQQLAVISKQYDICILNFSGGLKRVQYPADLLVKVRYAREIILPRYSPIRGDSLMSPRKIKVLWVVRVIRPGLRNRQGYRISADT